MKIDYRKKSQYIKINNYDVYVWLYKKENYIGYGIQGTSFHKCLNKYKDKTKNEIIKIIKEDLLNSRII